MCRIERRRSRNLWPRRERGRPPAGSEDLRDFMAAQSVLARTMIGVEVWAMPTAARHGPEPGLMRPSQVASRLAKPRRLATDELIAKANGLDFAVRAKATHVFARRKNQMIAVARAKAAVPLADMAYGTDRLCWRRSRTRSLEPASARTGRNPHCLQHERSRSDPDRAIQTFRSAGTGENPAHRPAKSTGLRN